MSQMDSGPTGLPTAPRSNIFTVLILIALVSLLCGVGYLAYKNFEMTGTSNPFAVMDESSRGR